MAVSENYDIVRYEPRFLDQVLGLQRYLWGPDLDRNARCFAWKFEENPFADEVVIYLVLQDGRVVGMRAMMGAAWQIGKDPTLHRILCSCDLVVEPEHRGRNVVRLLMRFALDDLSKRGLAVLFSFSASPFTFLSSIRSGWKLVTPYRTMLRQTRRKQVVEFLRYYGRRLPLARRLSGRLVPVLERSAARAFDGLADRIAAARHQAGIKISFAQVPPVEAMTALAARNRPDDGRIRHVKNQAFFDWRFRNPKKTYGFVKAESGNAWGYLVVQAPAVAGGNEAALVDWEVDDPKLFGAMVAALCRSGVFDSLGVWSAALAPELKTQLPGLGFAEVDDPRGIRKFTPGPLIRFLDDAASTADSSLAPEFILRPESWDLRPIFSDHF